MKCPLYLLLALSCALSTWSFPSSSNSVPAECVDPTFACQDIESARLCGVVKSCIHDVWSSMIAPDDNYFIEDEICDICKEMVKEARDQLLSNMTQEEIKEVFEGSCKLLPVKLIADACIKIVDEFIPELVEMLASRMDPNMVCTVSGLCNLAQLPIKESVKGKEKVKDELVCEFCTHVLQHIKDLVTANTTVEEFRTALQNFCKHTGSFSSRCTDLVNEYYDTIFDYIRNMNAKGFCTLITLCGNGKITKNVIRAEKIVPAFSIPETVPLVKLFPAKYVDRSNDALLTNEIFELQPSQLPVDRMSHPLAILQHDTECAFCHAISFYVEQDLADNKNNEHVHETIKQVCNKWVYEYPDHCKVFISKYGLHMERYISKGAEYNGLCTSIKACNINEEESDLSVKVILPKRSDMMCELCKETFNEIETYLQDPSTKASIEEFLDRLCTYMPKTLQDDCKNIVNQNLNTVLSILEQELTGDNVCPAIGLCPANYRKPKQVKSIECDVCKDFVEQLQNRLKDPDVKQSLRDLLERGCSALPTELANDCKNFVDQNVDNLINILVQDMDPNAVCSALKLCSGAVKKILLEIHDIECELCKEVVEKVDEELKDQRTEEEIREALDKICSYFPSKMSAKCQNFVDKYSQLLVTLLAEEMDPSLICAALKVCPAKDFECEGCQYLFHYIQNQLMDSENQESIKSEMKKICKFLPGNFSHNCIAYIDEFGSSLLVIIAQYLDPSTMCYSLHACGNSSINQSLEVANLVSLSLDECSLCTTVVDYLDKLLEEDSVDKEITQLIEKACSIIPSSMKDKCSILVETYGPYILQMIGQLADSKQVCQDIDMCPRLAGHVHLLGGRKCTFGPSYWCKSKAHAVACKAEEYCTKTQRQ